MENQNIENLEKENNMLKDTISYILSELRIDKRCLEVMANGQNPNCVGIMDFIEGNPKDDKYCFPYPVVQLSQQTSEMINKIDLSDFMIE